MRATSALLFRLFLLAISIAEISSFHTFTNPSIQHNTCKNDGCLRRYMSQRENSSTHNSMIEKVKTWNKNPKLGSMVGSTLAAFVLVLNSLMITTTNPQPASAEGSRKVGSISGSGLVFKDTLVVESFDDPKVQGVSLYISTFERPLTERLQKDFFSDPSFASVGCTKTGMVKVADNIGLGPQGEEVFEESRSLLFKTLRVQRIYDKEKNTVIYVSFNTRLDKNSDTNKSRFKSSTCAVGLE